MATSASVHTNTYGGRTITLTVEEISTSIENNTSTVRWTLTSGTSSTYHSVYDVTAWVGGTADSNKVYGPKTADWSSRAFPCKDGSTSGTLPIQHNADGTASPLTFRLRGSVYNNNPQNYDGSITLTAIPRASSFTISKTSGGTAATSWNLGESLYVNITRASSSFTHKVYFVVNNSGNQVISNSAGTSANTTLASSLAQYIPSASATATIYVDTYSGTTKIGSASKTFTINVPSNVLPSISSVTKTDTAGYLSTYGAYVQGKSNLRVQTSASGNYSSITNYTVQLKNGDTILNTKTGNDVTFSNISYTGTIDVLVTVTDSRNRQDTDTSPISIATYENPKITTFTAERQSNNATVTLTYNASITNINNTNVNSKTFRIYKRQKGTSSWGNAIATYTSGYTYSGSTTTSCDENYGWEFKLEAQDSFTTTTKTNGVGTAFELMNWKADGTAMAIGKVSEESNTFEVDLGSKFYKGLSSYSGVELFNATPYIDFHYNNSTSDYTSRIIEDGSNHLDIVASVNIEGTFTTNTWGNENTTSTWVPVWNGGNLEHRVIDANINSAMKSLERNIVFKGGTGSGTTDWHAIGEIRYDYHQQGSFCYVKIILGEGNNGLGNQNAWIDLYMQLGWTGSLDGRFGCLAYYHPGQTNMNNRNTQIKVMANSNTSYGIYLYNEWGYSCPNVIAYLPQNAHFIQHDFWTTSPGGTQCDLIYDGDGGVVLYDDATGTNGNVTLSETAANFRYLEIFFKITNADGSYNSQKIYLPNGKSTTLSIVHNYYTNNTPYSYLFSKRISISGTTITSVRNDYTQFRGTAINEHSTANNVYIVRVVGYR